MENATKALLIAAAILIAILIISLSLVVYRMASETIGNVNLSEAEMTQFNSKFTPYNGKVMTSTELQKFITNVIIPHNQQEKKAGTTNFVEIEATKSSVIVVDKDATSINDFKGGLPDGIKVQVKCNYQNGVINKILITTISN